MRRLVVSFIATGLTFAAGCMLAQAQTPQPYRPGLGDLMTMTVQPRHIKLALAGREKNWVYAAYELHELQEAFDRIKRVWPKWQSLPISDLINSGIKPRIALLQSAIKARDATRFAAEYGRLTEMCNICHQASNRGFVVIKKPEVSSFPNQDFGTPKP